MPLLSSIIFQSDVLIVVYGAGTHVGEAGGYKLVYASPELHPVSPPIEYHLRMEADKRLEKYSESAQWRYQRD